MRIPHGHQHLNEKAAAFCGRTEGIYPYMSKHVDGQLLRWEVAQSDDMFLHLCLDMPFAIVSKTAVGPWALGYGRTPNVTPLGLFDCLLDAKEMAQLVANEVNK